MRLRSHLILLASATSVWILFWLIGLPDYYRQYPTTFMLVLVVVLLFPVWGLAYFMLRPVRPGKRLRKSVALSIYFTVPFFVCDYLYCGLRLGHGLGFLTTYWYLTVYYVIPWLIIPPTAMWLDSRRGRAFLPAPGP